MAAEKQVLLSLIEGYGAKTVCKDHRDQLIIDEIKRRISDMQELQKTSKSVDQQELS